MSVPSSNIPRNSIEQIVRRIVEQSSSSVEQSSGSSKSTQGGQESDPNLVVSISARHIHLTDAHVEELFGPGKTLTPGKDLYQDGFYRGRANVDGCWTSQANAAKRSHPRSDS